MTAHEDQITDYPKGARIEAVASIPCHLGSIPIGTMGVVGSHCDDGRAWVFFDGYNEGHTFHRPEGYIRVVCTHRDDNCSANHEQPRPEQGAANAEQVKALAANWNQKSRLEQIIARHRMYDLSGIPNREYTASWEDVKLLIEQHSTLIAQREQLLDLVRQLREFVCLSTWGTMVRRPLAREAEGLVERIDSVLTTIEQEGTMR